MTDNNFDPFEDETSEGDVLAETETEPSDEAQEADSEKEDESQGEEEAAETPAAEDGTKDDQPEKMIPVHQFKAALKDVNEKLAKANQELNQLKAVPAPDKSKDPDGYERHLRLETSKAIMVETHADYDDVIAHFQDMAAENPMLNDLVANHPLPAKYAYDIAKKSMEIKELSGMKDSEEWKQFQNWKAEQAKGDALNLDKAKPVSNTPKVPNLNRATSVNRAKAVSSQDDNIFADVKY